MAHHESKSIVKRDASGRTIAERYEKIEAAVKQGNAAYRAKEVAGSSLPARSQPIGRNETRDL